MDCWLGLRGNVWKSVFQAQESVGLLTKDVLCLLNPTKLILRSKPLLTVYSCLWLAALAQCECMSACVSEPVRE